MTSVPITPRISAIQFDGNNALEILEGVNGAHSGQPNVTFTLSDSTEESFTLNRFESGFFQFGQPCQVGDWWVNDPYSNRADIVSAAEFTRRFSV